MGKFEIKTRTDGQFYFNLKAGNGEMILTSEAYTSKQGCEKGIESVKKNAPEDGRFDNRTSTNGKFYFVLKAGNGEIIGKSEMYESEAGRANGIKSVQKNAPDADVVEV